MVHRDFPQGTALFSWQQRPSQQRPSLVLQEFQCQLINIRTSTPRHHWKLREKPWENHTGLDFGHWLSFSKWRFWVSGGFSQGFLRFWGSKLKNKATTWIRSTNPTLYHVQRITVEVYLPEIAFRFSEWWLHHAMFEKHLQIMFWFPVGLPLQYFRSLHLTSQGLHSDPAVSSAWRRWRWAKM